MKLMYLSSGGMEMFDGSATRSIPSQRAEKFAQTLRNLEKQYAWKTEGEGAKFMKQSNPYANAAEYERAVVTGFAPWKDGILYSINLSGQTGAIHSKNPMDMDEPEGLVTSAASFQTRDLVMHDGTLYFSVQEGPGSHIAQINPESSHWDTITEGDTIERHPFITRDGRCIIFDMCGIARDSEQRIAAVGPSAIAELNRASGEIHELYANEEFNYLKYTQAADGAKRMMVRPYKSSASAPNPLGCLLAPFSALMGFVHVFSAINAARKGKEPPLMRSGTEAAQPMDSRINIDGVSVDLKQLSREQEKHKDEYPGLVPRDWKLVGIHPDGSQETLEHGVLDYLALEDGGYIYSNGRHVIQVDAQGKRTLLFKAHLATDLTILPEA